MKDPHVISTNFRVPKSCRHEWIIFRDREMIGAICGVPGKKQMRQHVKPVPDLTGLERNDIMDWMAESIAHLRHLCEE